MGAHSTLGNLSDAQAITADDTASTNIIDLAVTVPQVGVGRPIFLCIRTNTAPTNAADTISIELQNDADAAFSNPTVLMMICGANGAEITVSDARFATAGAWIWRGSLPYEIAERYLRLMYRNTTSNGTITLDAWLSDTPQSDLGRQIYVSPVGNP